jgi:hypothetical protein
MGLRFRKSIKLTPGLRLNVGKRSVGMSVGKRGARYSINSRGQQTRSVGIPGSGLSYRTTKTVRRGSARHGAWSTVLALVVLAVLLGPTAAKIIGSVIGVGLIAVAVLWIARSARR